MSETVAISADELYEQIRQEGPSFYPASSWLHFGRDDDYSRRSGFVKQFAWALPSRQAVAAIVAFADGATILEVGAGSGLWARLIRDAGASIIATDVEPWAETFTKVQQIGVAEAVGANRVADVLFLCWPPYEAPVAALAVASFTGSRVIYIGEGEGGCTGDDAFHDLMREQWITLADGLSVPQWPGIHDYLWLYHRTNRLENSRRTVTTH